LAQESFLLRNTREALSVHCDWISLHRAMGCFNSKGPGVTQYKGFKEHAYRLLFPYEDNFPEIDPAPFLLTILPSGVIENSKSLIAEKERALIAYVFSQAITKDVMAGKAVDFAESPWHGKAYTETPFVKSRAMAGDKHTLVQTWPTKINEKFKKDFKITESNPDMKKFEAAAVNDFKACIQEMFGKDAVKKVSIKFCHKATDNEFPCYLGTTEDLLKYFSLKDNAAAMSAVGIKEMTSNGFLATGEDGKGNKIEKPFKMEPKIKYVIYKKVGWETMGCCKPKEQFDKECEFLGKGEWKECK